jgi:hypothetical protein
MHLKGDVIIKAFFYLTLLFLFSVLLLGCNSKNILVSPKVIIEGEEVGIIGYVANETDTVKNALPSVYKEVEHQKVKPNTKVEFEYEDEPRKVVLKQWVDSEFLIFKKNCQNIVLMPQTKKEHTPITLLQGGTIKLLLM